MPGRQAKLITPIVLRRMLAHVRHSPSAARDRVIILLSVKAGLRACEIARLDWSMVLDARSRVADAISLQDIAAKKASGRRIPMHPDLADALKVLQRCSPAVGPIIKSSRDGSAMRANSIVNWFVQLFDELSIDGCSSHSGRRSFITAAARNVHRAGCSLRDVQLLAGHRSIETTQRYIDGHTDGQRKLVSLL
jgi:integrase/recombinase XerD